MKRFALTISLAACLVFLCGSLAMAADALVVESKTVLPNATGVTLGVYISNDLPAVGFVMPLEFREQTAGSYITTAFTNVVVAGNRLGLSPLSETYVVAANVTKKKYNTPMAQSCSGPISSSWTTAAAQVGFTTPDAILHATVSQGDPTIGDDIDMDPGSDPPGSPSYLFTFNVTGVQGTFIVDTMCATPANHLTYAYIDPVSGATLTAAMAFTPGIVTIFQPPNQCPAPSAGNVNASVGTLATNQVTAIDPEGDTPITFYQVSGNGTTTTSGLWSYSPTCADIPSFQVTVRASDKGQLGCPPGSNNEVTFTVNVSPAQLSIACGNVSAHWAAADASQQINVSGGCPPYTYTVTGLGSIDGSGSWSYDQGCSDVGSSQVTIRATDATQSFVECTFTLAVTNTLPTCAVIAPTLAPQGVPTNINLGPASQGDGDALTDRKSVV
jgi:hypothetical protein